MKHNLIDLVGAITMEDDKINRIKLVLSGVQPSSGYPLCMECHNFTSGKDELFCDDCKYVHEIKSVLFKGRR